MNDINFLGKGNIKGKNKRSSKVKKVMIETFGGVVLICVIAYIVLSFKAIVIDREQIAVSKEIKNYAVVIETKKNIEDYNKKIEYMAHILSAVSKGSVINTEMLKTISSIMPDNMYLMNYSVSNVGQINLEGKSQDDKSVAYFAHNLGENKAFDNVVVKNINSDASKDQSSDVSKGQGSGGYNFLIQINLKQ